MPSLVNLEFQRRLPDWTLYRSDAISDLRSVESEIELWRDSVGDLTLSRAGDPRANVYRLRFADQITVDLLLDEKTVIEIAKKPDLAFSTREHFIVDQVLPRLLAHQGQLVLHAGAVRMNGGCFVILGKSGSGKSTLCISFNQDGHALLGDDALIVTTNDEIPHVTAVYPSLRLLPDSLAQFFPASHVTSAVAHYTNKQRVRLPLPQCIEDAETEVDAIFLIDDSHDDDGVEVRPLSIARTCMALIDNSFMLDPTDKGRVRERFSDASALARQVPSFSLHYPRDYGRLGEVRAAMLAVAGET